MASACPMRAMGVVSGRRSDPGSGPLETIRAGQGARQCAAVPVSDANGGVRLRRAGAVIWPSAGAATNDLDETLTPIPSILTPPMQQAQAEMPSVESDQTAGAPV
jgi:hypothetical protein